MNKDDELQRMKNLGKTSAQWLHAAGIHKAADLRRLGSIEAYQAVKKRGFRVSKTFLYSIEAALQGMGWKELLDEQKAALNRKLETPDGLRTATAEETAK
ncbi:competence protein TfoX [Pseudomonas sp. Bc-h]|nr:competence protein TfoX [Pseudomonas sp. Bc-h]